MTDLRKTISLWVLLTGGVSLFVGCKKQSPPPPPPTPNAGAQAVATPGQPTEPANPTVVLRFPRLFENLQPLQQVLDQFHKEHPHIKVQAEPLPNEGTALFNSYLQGLSAKPAAVDIVMSDVTWLAALAEAGHLHDLTGEWPESERKDFLPGAVQATEYLGRTYALPWSVDGGAVFYRKDLLAAQGAQAPQSWGDLARVATQFQQKTPEIHGFVWPVKPSEDMVCAVLEFLYANGGHILNRNKAVANSPENTYALSFAGNLISRYKVTPPPSADGPDPRALFTQGKAFFIRDWTSAWPELDKAFPGQVGVAPLPRFPSKSSVSILRGWQLAVAARSGQPKSSLLLVKHLCSPAAQKALASAYPMNPAVISIYSHYEITTKRPELAECLPALRVAGPRPITPGYAKISQRLQEAFSKVLRGEATAEVVLAQLQADLMAAQTAPGQPNIL